jgi:two-component system response regulator AtoC
VGGEKEISVNLRLIAATNRDLEKEVNERRFRKDLFYRINVLSIIVPPLRDRREDIPILVEEILSQLHTEMQFVTPPSIDAAAMEMLKRYAWPGNVRELRNVLERAVIVSPDGHLTLELPDGQPNQDDLFQMRLSPGLSLQEATDEVAKSLFLKTLRACNGNKRAAAKMLGISRDTIYRFVEKFGTGTDD